MDEANNKNKEVFEHALKLSSTQADKVLDIVKQSDFYNIPFSTEGMYSKTGGLLKYTLAVYECLMSKVENKIWKSLFEEHKISNEDLTFVSLVSGFSKLYLFEKTEEGYVKKDRLPIGCGGERIIYLLAAKGVKLSAEQLYALRWTDNPFKADKETVAKHPLILALYEAKIEAELFTEN